MPEGYPAILTADQDGSISVEFPDIPEALTNGRDRAAALRHAPDALAVALGTYIEDGRDIPEPSAARPGQPVVALSPAAGARLALSRAMRARKVTAERLAETLGCTPSAVRTLLDLDRDADLDLLAAALEALGKRLVVAVYDAA